MVGKNDRDPQCVSKLLADPRSYPWASRRDCFCFSLRFPAQGLWGSRLIRFVPIRKTERGSACGGLCRPYPVCSLYCSVRRNVEGTRGACGSGDSSGNNGDCLYYRGVPEYVFDVAGVDAVVSATGMKISRIRYETASDRDNKMREVVSLCQLKPGERGEVVDIQKADRRVLQKLLAMAVVPGSTLKVEFTSPVVVFQVGNTRVAVDHGVAGGIRVCRIRRSPFKSIPYST